MNYNEHHDRLIERARNRILEGYCERHHVVPRCLGGSDDAENIVVLTPEEHYVAHQLLMKIYPNNKKLVWAAHRMTSGKYRNNKLYGWIRQAVAISMIGNTRGKGYKATDEHRRKNAAAKMGNDWNIGKRHGPLSAKQKQHLCKINTENPSMGMLGKTHTLATKKKMSVAKNKPLTINGITYPSRNAAAAALDISRNTLYIRINKGIY